MSNKAAIALGVTIVGLIAFDLRANDGEYLIFWGRQGLRLIDWMAIWR